MKNRVWRALAQLLSRSRPGGTAAAASTKRDRSLQGRGKGRSGNGGHPQLTSLHRDIARAADRRRLRERMGRWAP